MSNPQKTSSDSEAGALMLFDVPWNVIVLQLFFGLALGSIFVLLASGLSIIYGLLDVVNFAHGTFAMLGSLCRIPCGLFVG